VHAGRAARLLAVRVIPPADEVRVDSMAFTVRKLFDDETRSRFAERDATRLFFFSAKRRRSDARECAASESRFRGWIGITRGRALWRRARDDG
jgi:hypothetical protein